MRNELINLGCGPEQVAQDLVLNGIYNISKAKIHKARGKIWFTHKGFSFYDLRHRGKADLTTLQIWIDWYIDGDKYGYYSKSLGDSTKYDKANIALENMANGKKHEDFPEFYSYPTAPRSFWDFFKY